MQGANKATVIAVSASILTVIIDCASGENRWRGNGSSI